MYGCESWTIKKAEHQRTDAFELWCWRRLLEVPWTARRSNQSILKEISPEYSLEGVMLKLKLQYFGHLMRRTDSFGKTLMLGKTEGRRRRGDRGWDGWMASPTQWTWVWESSGSWWWTGKPGSPWGHQESDMTERLNWTDIFFGVMRSTVPPSMLSVMNWSMFSPDSYVEVLTLSTSECDCVLDVVFKDVVKLKWIY